MNVYLINESTVLEDAEIQSWLPAFRTFADHVRYYWPRPSTLWLVPASEVPKESWQMVFLDDSDQAGALGYHDFTPGGRPISKIFAKTDLDSGSSVTVTWSHEYAEMMADPWISELFQVTNTKLYAKEIGDPVEADEFGYTIKHTGYPDVLVSDFVTPAWFIPGHPGPVFDHAKHCARPLQLLPGGYMSIFVSGQGWTQVDARGEEVPLDKSDARFRNRAGL